MEVRVKAGAEVGTEAAASRQAKTEGVTPYSTHGYPQCSPQLRVEESCTKGEGGGLNESYPFRGCRKGLGAIL